MGLERREWKMTAQLLEEDLYEDEEEGSEDLYLTFGLEGQVYGISIDAVREVVGIQTITPLPGVPDHVKGVMNLRGEVIPVADVRRRFGREECAYGERTCVIIINTANGGAGLVVDTVRDVRTIRPADIAPPPHGAQAGGETTGLGKVGDEVVVLLDARAVLGFEWAECEALAASA